MLWTQLHWRLPILSMITHAHTHMHHRHHTHTRTHARTPRPVGDQVRAEELNGVSVFEVKQVRTTKKRKRKEKGDPGDPEGYMGPWREYEDQVPYDVHNYCR